MSKDKDDRASVEMSANAEGVKLKAEKGFWELLVPERAARVDMNRAIAQRVADGGLGEFEAEALASATVTHLDRERNVKRVVERAAENEAKHQLSPAPDESLYLEGPRPSREWANKFRRAAEDVESEEFVDLFARILAGEHRHPGCFSIRTIRRVEALSQKEAQAFQRARNLTMDLGSDTLGIHSKGLSEHMDFMDIMILQDAGLVGQLVNLTLAKGEEWLGYYGELGSVSILSKETSLTLESYPLTTAGAELAQIVAMVPSIPYLKSFLERWNPKLVAVTHNPETVSPDK